MRHGDASRYKIASAGVVQRDQDVSALSAELAEVRIQLAAAGDECKAQHDQIMVLERNREQLDMAMRQQHAEVDSVLKHHRDENNSISHRLQLVSREREAIQIRLDASVSVQRSSCLRARLRKFGLPGANSARWAWYQGYAGRDMTGMLGVI